MSSNSGDPFPRFPTQQYNAAPPTEIVRMQLELRQESPYSPLPHHARIWRYMSLDKFTSMLQTEALYFSRADLLSDRFEGSNSKPNVELRDEALKQVGWGDQSSLPLFSQDSTVRRVYINCWSRADVENKALWDIYVPNGGVAVRSTVGRYLDALLHGPRRESDAEFWVNGRIAGGVTYADYNTDVWAQNIGYLPFFIKRNSFAYEREYRGIVHAMTDMVEVDSPNHHHLGPADAKGIAVAADLAKLIEQVRISPNASSEFDEQVHGIVKSIGLEAPVVASDLSGDPHY